MLKLPSILPEILGKAAKFVIGAISQLSKKVSSAKPVDEKSSVSEIDNVIEMFEAYKEEIRGKASEIEEGVSQEVAYYAEELEQIFNDREALLKKYGIRKGRIDRQIKKLLSGMKGFIDGEVCRNVSLSNRELRNIIRMIPGTQKEQAMCTFSSQVFQEALDKYCRQVREMLSDLFTEVEEETLHVIEKAGENAQKHAKQLENMDAENYFEQSECMMAEAGYIVEGCHRVEKILEEQ